MRVSKKMRCPTLSLSCGFTTIVLIFTILLYYPSEGLCFRNLKEGEPVPDFSLKDLDGKIHTIAKEKGKVLIILYFRAGQNRSAKALEELKTISEKLSDHPLQILAVTKDTTKLSEIEALRKSLAIPFPILLDSEAKVYADFGVFVFPSTALIDRQGIYRLHYAGLRDDFQDEIFGQTRVLLGLITEEQLQAEREKKSPAITEAQAKAINHIRLGKALRKSGMSEKAVQELKKAVALDPNNAEGQILLGFALLDMQEADQALQHFQKGIELDPRSADAKIGLGSAYRIKGQTDKALAILKTGLGLCPDSATIHFELGEIFESLGKTQEALKHYKASAECSLKLKKRSF